MSDLWDNGTNKWLNKSAISSSSASIITSSTYFTGLVSCDVLTSTQNISFKVEKFGTLLCHIALSDIVGIIIDNNTLIIDTSDEIDYILEFISKNDVYEAEDRIYRMQNGENVGPCSPFSQLPDTITIYWGYYDVDPYPDLIVNGDTLIYQFSETITHNTNISIDYPVIAEVDKWFVIKVPSTESEKNNWFNTTFNYGQIPDQVFRDNFNLTTFTYYVTRIQMGIDYTQPIILS